MKKIMKWTKIVLAAAVVFCLAGCGTSEKGSTETKETQPADYIAAAQKTLEAANSVQANMQIQANMDGIEDGMSADIIFWREPLNMEVAITPKNQENTVSFEHIYVESKNEDAYLYRSYSDIQGGEPQWTKKRLNVKAEQDTLQIYDVQENIALLLQNGVDWKLEENQQPGKSVTVVGSIPVNQVYAVTEGGQFFQFVGMSGLHENYYSGVESVPVRIEMEERTGTVLSCEVDLTQTLQSVMNNVMKELDSTSTGVAVEAYQVQMKITKEGDAPKVEVPEEAQNAINYDSM